MFREVNNKLDLIVNDQSIQKCLLEACMKKISSVIRWVSIAIMICCEPTKVHDLWDELFLPTIEDYLSLSSTNNDFAFNFILQEMD